jgi:hypothetical protein
VEVSGHHHHNRGAKKAYIAYVSHELKMTHDSTGEKTNMIKMRKRVSMERYKERRAERES